MELFTQIRTFLSKNHIWMRIYKPNELSDPIAKAFLDGSQNIADAVTSLKEKEGKKEDETYNITIKLV